MLRGLLEGLAYREAAASMEPMDLVAVHGANKQPRRLVELDPLGRRVRAAVEQRLYLSGWIRQSFRIQMALRRRCDLRWDDASAFHILYEGWFLLRDPDRVAVLRDVSLLDLEFCAAMLSVLCLRQDPGLDCMD